MEEKYLYPAFPIMQTGFRECLEYPLSRVLATWGLTIREIKLCDNGRMHVICRAGRDGELTKSEILIINPLAPILLKNSVRSHFYDLIIRYPEKDSPVWSMAMFLGGGHHIILNLETQEEFIANIVNIPVLSEK